MRKLLLLVLFPLLFSCGSYRVSTTPKVKIAKILTITSTGDTLAVPMRDFQKYNFNTYDFNRFNFNSGFYWNSWQYPYYGYGWNRPFQPFYHDWWYSPIPNSTLIRPQIQSPSVRRVEVKGRRGSNNTQINRDPDVIDRVIEKLNNRGIEVDVIERPIRSNNNNYTPQNNPPVRRFKPPTPPSTPRVNSTPNVIRQSPPSKGRRNNQ